MVAVAEYAGRKAAWGLYTLLWVSLGAFKLSTLAPGDFFSEARLNPQISHDALVARRAERGLDRPLPVKYGHWLKSVLRGEWGFSLSYNMPVAPLLWSRMRNTLLLTCTAVILCWLIAVPAGIWLATAGGARNRILGSGGLTVLIATPETLVVLLLQFLAVRSGHLPAGGMLSITSPRADLVSASLDVATHLAVPVVALVVSALPILTMHSASAIASVLEAPFIRGARANGISTWRLLYRHALPAAAHPLIALAGLSAGTLLSASVLVESAVGWPGLGRLLLEATLARDGDVVMGVVILSAAFLVAGSFFANLLLFAADPRIRRE